jgi:tRNA modification GTPase
MILMNAEVTNAAVAANWRFVGAPPVSGSAIGVFQLSGDIDHALRTLELNPVGVGSVARRRFSGIDDAIVARFTERAAYITVHGGRAVIDALISLLRSKGIAEPTSDDPGERYPEAADVLEARMLDALSKSASPLAVDQLLIQPNAWRASSFSAHALREDVSAFVELPHRLVERTKLMRRLIDPPLIVAIGAPNIGKSTLLNELAGRAAATVADQPGTTRDHVGAMIDIGGLAVRYVDAPGVQLDESTRRPILDTDDHDLAEAQKLACICAWRADLVLACCDSRHLPPESPKGDVWANVLRVELRSDLGSCLEKADVRVSVKHGQGVDSLVRAVRNALIPDGELSSNEPWVFWG